MTGIALSLTTATQIRLVGPIGAGELLLSLVTLRLIMVALVRRIAISDEARALGVALLALMVVGGASMAGGSWIAGWSGIGDSVDWRTGALVLAALAFPLLLVATGAGPREFAIVVVAMATSFALQFGLLGGWEKLVGDIPLVDLWYEGDVARFTALASNPNQLALGLVPLPFLLVGAVRCLPDWLVRPMLALAAIVVIAGVMTVSDALAVGWSTGLLGMTGVYLATALTAARRSALGAMAALAIILMVGAVGLGIASGVLSTPVEAIESRLNEGNQAGTRLTLWYHGLAAAAASPLLGFGPGAFSGEWGPFEAVEAHSTIVDWLTMSGAMGAAMLLFLWGLVVWRCIAARSYMCMAAVMALLAFSMFHNVLRQPLFWFFLAASYVLASASLGTRARLLAVRPVAGLLRSR